MRQVHYIVQKQCSPILYYCLCSTDLKASLFFSEEKWSCLKKRTLQNKWHQTGIELVGDKKASDGRLIAVKRSKEHLSPCITRNSSEFVQPQGLLIEKLSAMRCHTQTHVHMCPLSCSRMSPVLMKHSPYPLPSLSPYIPTKWVWWGSISQANRVRIVLLRSYLPSALQLSACEDMRRVLSVFSPWLVVVFWLLFPFETETLEEFWRILD